MREAVRLGGPRCAARTRRWALAGLLCCLGCSSNGAAELGELCGNGVLDPGETCDDGNRLDGDNCSSRCDSTLVEFGISVARCPTLLTLSVVPSEARLGEAIALSASASGAPGTHYWWTGSGGLLDDPLHAGSASYTCGYQGEHTLTLWIFNSDGCVDHQDLAVLCK